jgi:hypothetical protein
METVSTASRELAAIALDDSDNIHISSTNTCYLWYAFKYAANPSGVWVTMLVTDPYSQYYPPYGCSHSDYHSTSIALTSDGAVHMSDHGQEGTLLLSSSSPCVDNDGDGYGYPASLDCLYLQWDCNDSNPEQNPGLPEGPFGEPSCSDGVDNDCNGYTDTRDYKCCECIDMDNDGYGAPACMNCTYSQPDCDDTNANVYPGMPEDCANGIDDDCDEKIDDYDSDCPCIDNDGDGYGVTYNPNCTHYGDCDDSNGAINPGAQEIECNLVDEDCTGSDYCAGPCVGVAEGSISNSNPVSQKPYERRQRACMIPLVGAAALGGVARRKQSK